MQAAHGVAQNTGRSTDSAMDRSTTRHGGFAVRGLGKVDRLRSSAVSRQPAV